MGPQDAAPRAVVASTTAGSTTASTCGSSRCRNWTELDIWHYIGREDIEIPSIYFSHQRRVFERDGMLLSESELQPAQAAARRSRSAPSGSAPSAT